MGVDRRELLKRGGIAAGVAWVAPTVLSLDAVSAASAGCSCADDPVLFFAAGSGTHQGEGVCTTYQDVTMQVCRTSTTQTVVVSSDATGGSAPYFDELGVITVTTPTAQVFAGNVIFFQDQCRDVSAPNLSTGGPVDISSLFGGECGTFSVNIQVRNAFTPYGWNDTYVVPL